MPKLDRCSPVASQLVKLKASVPIATSRLGNGKLCRTESCSGEDNFVAKLGKNPGLVTAAGVGGTRKNSVYRPGRMRIRLELAGGVIYGVLGSVGQSRSPDGTARPAAELCDETRFSGP
jgi:hypothetical protein